LGHSLNINLNPIASNQVWVTLNQVWVADSYLKAGEGWLYLAVVMDLYSRCIIGWYISKCMTTDLQKNAFIKVCNLCNTLQMMSCRRLNLKIPLEKYPVGVNQNSFCLFTKKMSILSEIDEICGKVAVLSRSFGG